MLWSACTSIHTPKELIEAFKPRLRVARIYVFLRILYFSCATLARHPSLFARETLFKMRTDGQKSSIGGVCVFVERFLFHGVQGVIEKWDCMEKTLKGQKLS